MEHLRQARSIVSERISGHVTVPLGGSANDNINAQAKARPDCFFEQAAHMVSLDLGIDDQIAALDISFPDVADRF
jgi:hypothetical protein